MNNELVGSTIIFGIIFFLGAFFGALVQKNYLVSQYNTKAVQSGCATRVLDSLSGDVKTVWKGERK